MALQRGGGGRRSKYGATPTVVNGFRFASKREAARYQELLLLGLAQPRRLVDLELQPRFPLVVNGRKVGDYVADFRYREWQWDEGGCSGRYVDVVEDAKGMRTPVYRLKKKLVEATYGIEIREV